MMEQRIARKCSERRNRPGLGRLSLLTSEGKIKQRWRTASLAGPPSLLSQELLPADLDSSFLDISSGTLPHKRSQFGRNHYSDEGVKLNPNQFTDSLILPTPFFCDLLRDQDTLFDYLENPKVSWIDPKSSEFEGDTVFLMSKL